MTDCDHENVDWDWGAAQPSMDRVIIPGWCPDCESELDRVYDYKETIEN